MYKTLIVYSQIYVKIYIKNRGETAVIEDVYKNVLQRVGSTARNVLQSSKNVVLHVGEFKSKLNLV
jgi:hypothetical protein